MKKLFYSTIVAMIAIATVFTSCSKDDDEPVVVDPFDHAQITIDYELSADLLEYFDASFNVTNFDGKTEELKITQAGKGTKTYTTKEKNGKATINFTTKMKSNNIDTKERTFTCLVNYTTAVIEKDGGVSQSEQHSPGLACKFNINSVIADEIYLEALKTTFTCSYTNSFNLKDGAFE